ncbi:MAG: methyl-accepting chemotaxis protein [Gammaproteobacteria bacterium]|nr:methyl-accepting chemotaxis protein [Gammaproteobacteria bacterium]
MKVNLPVTGVEKPFNHGSIVTKTDLKGIITYANDGFVEMSGFAREELIGKSHNVVRHPDMPPAAFADLWETVKRGEPWRGIVKNRCKNGDHYWVDAFVVPIRKKGQVTGFMSVRTPPSRDQIAAAEQLYSKLKAGGSLPGRGLGKRLTIRGTVLSLSGILGGALAGSVALGQAGLHTANLVLAGVALALALGILVKLLGAMSSGFGLAYQVFEKIAEGDLTSRLEIGGENEFDRVLTSLAYMQVHLKVILDEVAVASTAVTSRTDHLREEVRQVSTRFNVQSDRVMQVSAAMEEMSVSIREVAEGAKGSAQAAAQTHEIVEDGNGKMGLSMESTTRVVAAVESSGTTIGELNQSIQKIGDITKVIKEIADQTNLLALNAAIEAARAGEQGRGFAVVADEVRKLAERTASSTADIACMIDEIRTTTGAAVQSMAKAAQEVEQGRDMIVASSASLREIMRSSDKVSEMAQHIASAADEQSIAGEEVANNMEKISLLADESVSSIQIIEHSTDDLARVAQDLQELVRHFDEGR